ncbi:hypothetical protein, conserved [Leishmania donovani]|uniref:Uncharacterized protein n=1 Tax=Leishmania donovani TaxID=5661 RepID=A0A3S7WQL0_LEIDO|nr:hypothetical protein, conserved [Leishmania donovani]AYU76483.1 hypothetical protein LdCL_090009400 [Leishmania donovani]TPP41903.1 hypothetical protein CGC21_18350 [Leishmania donovani]CBZ31996.1 hypothetical protein, conserved [Leishmania donovani]
MPAAYALAKECQLLRGDIEGVLSLAAQLLLHTTAAASSSANGPPTAPASSSAPATSFLGPVVGSILTDAHVRSLLLNTLVRVLVPARRQKALLDDNKYVQAANMVALQQQSTNDARPANSVNRAADVSQRYRVGRVVGVVPKPGPMAAEASHGKSASATCGGLAAAAADEGQRWLLAVYVGECVEPFAVSAIAEDIFTEAEHRVFVQSALSTNREDGSRRASVLPSQQPALLSAETAATVQQSIKDIRVALQLMQAADKTVSVAGMEAATATLIQRASGLKRPHAASDDDGDINSHKRRTGAASIGEDSDGLGTYFGNGASSQAVRMARLSEDLAARGAQLQQLRQLLQQKDQEVKAALQQQQQQEARHRSEIDVWRAKVEEQSRTRERVAKESRESLEQRDRLLEEANTKLRRLAGMATKYKQVVDAVAALLKRNGGGEASDGTVMTPEDILIALQGKKCL